ncbi:MAG: hypothetical protein AAGC71_15390 [Pseudomonadota bacterium]
MGEQIGLPLVALLGGYLFVSNFNLTKVWTWQFSGHRLYFAYATAGLLWFTIARILDVVLRSQYELLVIGKLVPAIACAGLLSLLFGLAGHLTYRVEEVRKAPDAAALTATLAFILNIASLYTGLTETIIAAVAPGALTGTGAFIGIMFFFAPWYRQHSNVCTPQNEMHRRFLRITNPNSFGQRFCGWPIAAFTLGLFLVILALWLTIVSGLLPTIERFWLEFSSLPDSGVFATSFLLAYVSPFALNLLFPEYVAKHYSVAKNFEDSLESLIWSKHKSGKLIQFDLNTGKVYIGWVIELPASLEPAQSFIDILPLISGYRTPNEHELILTTFYHEVYSPNNEVLDFDRRAELAPKFSKVIAADLIVSATEFDVKSYTAFERARTPSDSPDPLVADNSNR